MPNKYASLLANRSLMLISIGETISQFGNRLHYLALLALVLKMTGRTLDIGAVTLLTTIPAVIFGPVAGWLADRLPRKTIIVVSNGMLALLTLALTQARTLWSVYALTLGLAVVSSFFTPAKQAMLPSLVSRDELVEMNAFQVLLNNIVQIAGPAVGGIVVAAFGSRVAFAIDAGTFFVAACMSQAVKYRQELAPGRSTRFNREALNELFEGARLVWKNVAIRYVTGFDLFLTLVMSMQGMLTFLYVQAYLGTPVAARAGWLFAMVGVGAIVGGLVIRRLLRVAGKITVLLMALAFDGAVVLVFSQTNSFWVAMGLFAMLGVIGGAFGVTAGTIIQQETPEEIRGRVYGLMATLRGPVSLLSIGAGATLAGIVGPRWVFFGAGLGELLLAAGGRLARSYRIVRSK